jgi:stage V sporulation protein SpoVS
MEYPVIPQPMSPQSQGNLESITISTSQTVKAIAIAPGYSSPSAVSSATYVIN